MQMLCSKRLWVVGVLVCWLGLQPLQSAWGSDPNSAQAVKLLVGYPPGGLADRLSRLTADYLSQELKRQITVKNLGGANGIRAGLEAQNSNNDAAVLLFADSSLIVAQLTSSNNTSDLQLFDPVGTMGFTPFAVAVPTASPFRTLQELMSFIRQNPGAANYGSPGVYSVHQLGIERLLQRAGVKAQHIPYQGGTAMLSDLLQQRLTFGVVSIQLAQQHVHQNQLRVLAVTGSARSPQMPDVPALSETYPRFSAVSTAYLLAAPNMEPGLYKAIVSSWRRLMSNSKLTQKLEESNMDGGMRNDAEAALLIRQETERLRQTLRQIRIE